MKKVIAIASLLSLSLLLPVAQGQSSHAFLWTATGGMHDLGSLGGNFSQAQAINASGAVVGYSYLADNSTYHAFLWTAAGGMQDLGAPGGKNSVATAINGRGQIAGYSVQRTSTGFVFNAILWTAGVPRFLGTLGGQSSDAEGLTDSGVVVGSAQLEDGHYHPMMWTLAGGMQDLGTLGIDGGAAYGVNSSGEVVGTSGIEGHLDEPYSWTSAGGMKDLLPHHFYAGGSAYAINRYGNIAGWVNDATSAFPALWTAGGLKRLPSLGGTSGIGLAINGKNQVVGYASTGSGSENHAFLWSQSAGITDLGTLGGTNSQAWGINNAGQVVGYSDLP